MSELRIRPAARAIVLDPDDRILLVRFELRWWALAELEKADETCAPRRLAELLGDLVGNGPPPLAIDAGV